MCNTKHGKELLRVFTKYYSGRQVDESDSDVLYTLSITEYLEYYIHHGKLYARAGPIGKLFRKPKSAMFA